ncbi:MAG: response regulator transcription factor, partial [Burkholderiales bacterium]
MPKSAAAPKKTTAQRRRKPLERRRATGIRVMLVDAQRMLREGLRIILAHAGDMVVVAEADDGSAALALARALAPDVAVVDINLAGMSGIEATRRMLAENPGIRV